MWTVKILHLPSQRFLSKIVGIAGWTRWSWKMAVVNGDACDCMCVVGMWRVIHDVRRACPSCPISSHLRETASVHRVQLRIGGTEQVEAAHPVAHRRTSVPVSALPVRQPRHVQTQTTSPCAHRRKTVRVWYLQPAVYTEQQSQGEYCEWKNECLVSVYDHLYWLHSSVVRTSVSDRRTFPGLCSICSRCLTTYVGITSAIGHPTRPTQPFILPGSINE